MSAANEKARWCANTTRPQTKTNGSTFNAPAASAASGLVRDLLPEPVAYYEAQGLTLQGPRSAQWRTTECRFHGGSDSMRIRVATGAFVCMACGARGGDVVVYEMTVHGIGFVQAARQLGAWSGDAPQRHIRPTALSWQDRKSLVAFEANLIAVEGTRIGRWIDPSDADLERIRLASARITPVMEM